MSGRYSQTPSLWTEPHPNNVGTLDGQRVSPHGVDGHRQNASTNSAGNYSEGSAVLCAMQARLFAEEF